MKKSADYNVFVKMLEGAEVNFRIKLPSPTEEFIEIEIGENHVSTTFYFDNFTGELSHTYTSD